MSPWLKPGAWACGHSFTPAARFLLRALAEGSSRQPTSALHPRGSGLRHLFQRLLWPRLSVACQSKCTQARDAFDLETRGELPAPVRGSCQLGFPGLLPPGPEAPPGGRWRDTWGSPGLPPRALAGVTCRCTSCQSSPAGGGRLAWGQVLRRSTRPAPSPGCGADPCWSGRPCVSRPRQSLEAFFHELVFQVEGLWAG